MLFLQPTNVLEANRLTRPSGLISEPFTTFRAKESGGSNSGKIDSFIPRLSDRNRVTEVMEVLLAHQLHQARQVGIENLHLIELARQHTMMRAKLVNVSIKGPRESRNYITTPELLAIRWRL